MAPLIPFIPLILGGISAAGAGVAAYEMTQQPSAPKAPTQTQTAVDQAKAGEAAAQAQATAMQRRRGMASTILTSPLGTSTPASTQKSTLG
jgi:hypothetical protein